MTHQQSSPRVFISYSHDSEAHKDRVLSLANQLVKDGVDAHLDEWVDGGTPAKGWPLWMQNEVEKADFVLMVCTEIYHRRFRKEEQEGSGLGVTWEGAIITQELYDAGGRNTKFIPVCFDPNEFDHIPTPLRGTSRYLTDTPENYEELYARLLDQPLVQRPKLGPKVQLTPKKPKPLFAKTREPLKDHSHSRTLDPKLGDYRAWALNRYSCLELIGVDAGNVRVDLDKVFVPLRVADRGRQGLGVEDSLGAHLKDSLTHRRNRETEDIDIESVLHHGERGHGLIFGEPGSGKTTALLKLQQLCWREALGIESHTIPVFLRLRHLTPELLERGLVAFIDSEIDAISNGEISDIGHRLWTHGRLLLLFDGLDEIADMQHRTKVLSRISWAMGQSDARHMRAVVSCRRIGLPKEKTDREGRFNSFEVRPLQNDQIRLLVTQWFRELTRKGRIDQGQADDRVSKILDALDDPAHSSQRILSIVSNPLLLTLLCVVVLLGDKIPERRVRFYQQCLDVMLIRWPRQRGQESPIDDGLGRQALEHLAYYLHSKKHRDNLRWTEALARLKEVLRDRPRSRRYLEWLHEDVGILVDYTDETYGFVHLGIQEHLAACHLEGHPGDFVFLGDGFDESWWAEVFLQVSALSSRGFSALVGTLLRDTDCLEHRAYILRECLAEAAYPDFSVFLETLESEDPPCQEAILRLVRGYENDLPKAFLEQTELLAGSQDPRVQQAAQRVLDAIGDSGGTDHIAILYEHPDNASSALQLAESLKGWRGGLEVTVVVGTGRSAESLIEECELAIFFVGSQLELWDGASDLLSIFDEGPQWACVSFLSECPVHLAEGFEKLPWFHWAEASPAALCEPLTHLMSPPTPAVSARMAEVPESTLGATVDARPYTDPISGELFLPVPGGRFMMGDNELFTPEELERFFEEEHRELVSKLSIPAHPARLSPYWLARTPVTNQQYERFFRATSRDEPGNWRDRRFSASDQPVVGVSWEDAVAYCAWLTEQNPNGYHFELPTEAQWEFAARRDDGRVYPWGSEEPSSTLANYGLDYQEGKPAAVGSFPDGIGPFDHLDLAGGVWEWCRDLWEPDYSRWVDSEVLDPVGEADAEFRPLRGGCWWPPARNLRSADRDRDRPRYRLDDVGFRVLCRPPELES